MTPELDAVSEPSFLNDLQSRDMDDLRSVRGHLQQLENSLSYVRRLIQGRVDIVGGELQRRREGGDEGNTSDLIGRLPDILSEARSTAPGSVRPPMSLEPNPEVTSQLEAMLENIVAVDQLSDVVAMDEKALATSLTDLNGLEDQVSVQRRRMHALIDEVQAEVTRRYTTGEATVDGLLSS